MNYEKLLLNARYGYQAQQKVKLYSPTVAVLASIIARQMLRSHSRLEFSKQESNKTNETGKPMETTKVNEHNAALFGLSAEQAENIGAEITPALDLGKMAVGSSVRVKFLESVPRKIEHEENMQKQTSTQAIKVLNLETGTEATLWLSGASIKREALKLFEKAKGNLKDVTAVISVEEYEHEKWGMTRAYRIQQSVNAAEAFN